MGRILNLVLLAVMIVGAVVTYDMKHKAEKAAERVARLQSEITREKEEIQLLRAELSALLQPARLQAVVERYPEYFKLEALEPSQYATVDEIPMKPLNRTDEETIADIIGMNRSAIP